VANKPYLENRPHADLPGLQRAVKLYTQDLQRYLDEFDAGLPDVGPGAGTYGGGGNFVESVELDDQGRVLALTANAPAGGSASRDGSIFSMTGPGGATAPIVAYDFTEHDTSLTLSQKILAANKSGDSDYDLEPVGTPVYTDTGTQIASVRSAMPFATHVDGAALFGMSSTDYARSIIHPPGLLLQGAMTMEWLGFMAGGAGGGTVAFIDFSAAGGTSADNCQYQLFWSFGGLKPWGYFHQDGVATPNQVDLVNTSDADMVITSPILVAITRAATTGALQLYVNGRKVGASATAAAAFPTGGSSAKLNIGQPFGLGDVATMGVRIFDVALTPAQIQASYRRTFFGVS
jgi:hypothetical protein